MKFAKASGTVGLAIMAAMSSQVASAEDSGWYVGGNVGQTRSTIDKGQITSDFLSGGLTTTTIDDDDRTTGYKVFGGYQFNKMFSVEGGYFDLGSTGFKATTVPAGTLSGELGAKGLNLDLVGTIPFTEKFSLLGRVGVIYAESDARFAGTGVVTVADSSPSKHETSYKYGLGLQYAFTESLAMRAEAERYRINDTVGNHGDIDLVSLGLVYRFGGSTPAPAPVAVAAAPMPEPVVARAPAPTKVSFSADSLFDFNKETVKPAGKPELDQFASDVRDTDYVVINVTGHTDRIGPHAYNMDLSTRRAEAVKRYLVEFGGIQADKITVRGVNGAEPVTKPGDCVGTKKTKALIACLAPDRRVEVEVTGTVQN